MSQLGLVPVYRITDTNGVPVPNARLYTFLTGTLTAAPTYTTSALNVSHGAYVQADSAGLLDAFYLDPAVAYRYQARRSPYTAGDVIEGMDFDPVNALDSSSIPFLQSGTGAEAETLEAALRRLPLFPEQYGAVGDGVADDTAALQEAIDAAVASQRPLVLTDTYKITGQIVLDSNLRVAAGWGAATVTTAAINMSLFFANGKTSVRIEGIKFVQTVPGTTAYWGGVALQDCSRCEVTNCEFQGMQWAGVYLSGTTHSKVIGNYFHGFLGAVQDSADVCVYNNSTDNEVAGNNCQGGNWHGILIQDPYAGLQPMRNNVHHNYIAGHGCYGIACYVPGDGAVIDPPDLGAPIDTFNGIHHNVIENITGAQPLNLAAPSELDAGAGVYVVGYGAGGTEVSNNRVRNCCTGTNRRQLAPACISVLGLHATNAPISVTGNLVADVAFYDGINVSTCGGAPINVTGNVVRMPSSNSTGDPLYVENANYVTVSGNSIRRVNGARAIYVSASAVAVTNIVLAGNQVVGRVEFARDGGAVGTFTDVSITGLNSSGVANGQIPLVLVAITRGAVAGCVLDGSNTYAMSVVACTATLFSGNALDGGFITSGTCTGSVFDKSNAAGGAVDNAGTGFLVEQYSTAAPATGTGAVGDRRENSVPAAGQPKGWRCTTAGAPGTWTSEGNL